MPSSRLASFLAVLTLSALFVAGCADRPNRILTTEEAPLGPSSLKVGEDRLGQYLRTTVNETGSYTICHPDCEERDYENRRFVERWISRGGGVDAFLNPVEVFRYKHRYTDLDADEEHGAPISTGTQGYDVKTRRLVYIDQVYSYKETNFECSIIGSGCNRVETPVTVDQRVFPRSIESEQWGSLAGQVLTLHKTLTFNRTVRSEEGGVEYVYEFYRNYTALREAEHRGERVFAIKIESSVRQVKPPPEPRPAPSSREPVLTGGGDARPPPPRPIEYTYVGSKSPMPVKIVRNYPQWSQERRHYVWDNLSIETEVVEVGGDVVRYAGEPLVPYPRLPGAGTVTAGAFAKDATSSLGFPLSAAWAELLNNPRDTSFKAFLDKNPKAFPLRATFFPDASKNAYTWLLSMTTPGNSPEYRTFEARLDYFAPQRSLPVYQSGQNTRYTFSGGPGAGEKALETPLVTFDDALKMYQRAKPGAPEPAASLALNGYGNFPMWATLTLGGTEVRGSSPTSLFGSRWEANGTVEINLRDGGLAGLNTSRFSGIASWPRVMGGPFGAPNAPDPGLEALLPPAYRTLPPGWRAEGVNQND